MRNITSTKARKNTAVGNLALSSFFFLKTKNATIDTVVIPKKQVVRSCVNKNVLLDIIV